MNATTRMRSDFQLLSGGIGSNPMADRIEHALLTLLASLQEQLGRGHL